MLRMRGAFGLVFFFLLTTLPTCFLPLYASVGLGDRATQTAVDFDFFDDVQASAEQKKDRVEHRETTDQEALDFLGLDEQDEASDQSEKYEPAVFNSRIQYKNRDRALTAVGALAGLAALAQYKSSDYKVPYALLGGAGALCTLIGLSRLTTLDYSQAPLLTISRDGVEFHRLNEWYSWKDIDIEILKVTLTDDSYVDIPIVHSGGSLALILSLVGLFAAIKHMNAESEEVDVGIKFHIHHSDKTIVIGHNLVDDIDDVILKVDYFSHHTSSQDDQEIELEDLRVPTHVKNKEKR